MKLREATVDPEARYLTDTMLFKAIFGQTASNKIIPKFAKLIADYPGIEGLLRLDISELADEYGFGYPEAVRIQAVFELAKRLREYEQKDDLKIRSPYDAVLCIRSDLAYLDHEEMRVLLLDTKHHAKANILLYQGTVNATTVRAAEVFRPAIVRKYPVLFLFHCHPSGDATPSPEDLEVTKQLVEAAKVLDIELLDHIIIAGHNNYCSIRDLLRWD